MTNGERRSDAPPWYIRVTGLIMLGANLSTYLFEMAHGHEITTPWEIVGHALWGVIGLTMAYPEGGRLVLGFVRRTVPFLDRRSVKR